MKHLHNTIIAVLCEKCRKKHGVTSLAVDCHNCEGWKVCLHWLWNGEEPQDTVIKAGSCRYFALMGSHRYRTCSRGDV